MSKKLPERGYKFFKAVLRPIYKFYYRPKIYNKEVIPKDGPIIICCNHKHLYDQCSIIIATKRVIHYMAKIEYWQSAKTRWFFNLAGCIPVNRQIHDEDAKQAAIDVLEHGGAIGIFPEGTRNKTIGTENEVLLLPFKFGAVSMAKKTDATIVPFGLMGDHKVGNRNLTLVFGTPFKVGEMTLEEANELLREKIKNLALEAEELGLKRVSGLKNKLHD